MTRARAFALILGLLALAPAGRAQEPVPLRVSSAVAPETVTVGDRFRSVLQVVPPPGASVEFAPLAVRDSLQPADSLAVIPGRGGEPPIAAYSLVAWAAGAPLAAEVPVRVTLAGGDVVTYVVPLRLPVVRSVLPPDTAGLRPRPARAELEADAPAAPVWPLALLFLLILLAAGGAAAWLLRRRPRERGGGALTPRQLALAALDRLAADSARRREPERLYPEATGVLRRYLAEAEAGWSQDLTTSELVERLRAGGVADTPRETLRALLLHADRVKFARHLPSEREIERFLVEARRWVEAFPPPAVAEKEAA